MLNLNLAAKKNRLINKFNLPKTNGGSLFYLIRDSSGAAAMEFAFIVPIFLIIIVGIVDIGLAIHARFNINTQVSAASNFTLINGREVKTVEAAQEHVQQIASFLNEHPYLDESIVDFNNYIYENNVNNYYCPSVNSSGVIDFGETLTEGYICPDDAPAGRFINIRASISYTPLFGWFGLVSSGDIAVNSLVRIE